MKALAVRQPWASLIESGAKTLEVRSWFTHYRGPVLIVAAKNHWGKKKLFALPTTVPIADGPRGVTLCIVELVNVRPARPEDEGRALVKPGERDYVWEFQNPRPVKRVPTRARLSLYGVEPDLLAAIA